jgi:hypothetical protein
MIPSKERVRERLNNVIAEMQGWFLLQGIFERETNNISKGQELEKVEK